jgi:hypothetical protein
MTKSECYSNVKNLYQHLMGYSPTPSNADLIDLTLDTRKCQEYYDLKAVRDRTETELKKKFLDEMEDRKQFGNTKFPTDIEYDKLSTRSKERILGREEYEKICSNIIFHHRSWYQDEVRKALPYTTRVRYAFREDSDAIGWTTAAIIGTASYVASKNLATGVIVGAITEAFWKIFGSRNGNRTI